MSQPSYQLGTLMEIDLLKAEVCAESDSDAGRISWAASLCVVGGKTKHFIVSWPQTRIHNGFFKKNYLKRDGASSARSLNLEESSELTHNLLHFGTETFICLTFSATLCPLRKGLQFSTVCHTSVRGRTAATNSFVHFCSIGTSLLSKVAFEWSTHSYFIHL